MQTIVLVDEDCSFAGALGKALEKQGRSLHWIRAHKGLVREIERFGHARIVVDPGLSGYLWFGLLDDVRRAAPIDAVHVVTAFASSALRRRAIDIRAKSFLVKPTAVDDVATAILGGEDRWDNLPRPTSLAAIEWEAINEALYQHQGNATLAARTLRIPRQTLYRKLRRYSPIGREEKEVVVHSGAGASRLPVPSI